MSAVVEGRAEAGEHLYLEGHGGDGYTEPASRECSCSCGVELHSWMQYYHESDGRDPHRGHLAHLLDVAASDPTRAPRDAARTLLASALKRHELEREDVPDLPDGSCSTCLDVTGWSIERGCLLASVLAEVEGGVPLTWVLRRVEGRPS